ncbi:MAG: transposase [Bryobacteraceae bacterium]
MGATGIKDPVLYHHPTRRSVGYFGAVRLRDGKFLYRREPGRFNGESFWEFMKFLCEASATNGRRVIVISDNAQYHRSCLHLPWREQQASAFALDFLPPYSPELNPIERVWKLTRRLCLHNRYFGFLETHRSGGEPVCGLAKAKRNPSQIMRNYLRRCV